MASSRSRSLPLTSMLIPVRMNPIRMPHRNRGIPKRIFPLGFIHVDKIRRVVPGDRSPLESRNVHCATPRAAYSLEA